MAEDRAFDFSRIDIFAAGYDHVLHPVMDIEIAILVQIAGVTGLDPAALCHGFLGRVRQVPIAKHVVGRPRPDFAHFAVRHVVPRTVDNAQLDTGQRLARAAHPRIAIGVMVFRRQHHDGPGRFGHPVSLNKLALEHLDTLAQQLKRDRRCAVEYIFQPAEIDLGAARMLQQDMQGGRHNEQPRDSPRFYRVEKAIGCEFCKNISG